MLPEHDVAVVSSSSSSTDALTSSNHLLVDESDDACEMDVRRISEARLQEEEDQDMLRTLQLLHAATTHLEYEEALKEQEEADMGKTMEILTNALSEEERKFLLQNSTSGRVSHGKVVQFAPVVKVAVLPEDQYMDARMARKKYWDAGPYHDELWDGDLGAFREVELTPQELAAVLLRRNSKTNVTLKLRNFLFGSRTLNIDAESHARKLEDVDEATTTTVGTTTESAPGSPKLTKDKRRSSSRLLSFIRRRSTKTQRAHSKESLVEKSGDTESRDWLIQVMEQGERLNDVGEAVEEFGSDDDDEGGRKTPSGSRSSLTAAS